MTALSLLTDADLLARLPLLVQSERRATVELIEHLVEVERRRLYLSSSSSLYRYCIDRLGYAEDAALKRHRVAKLALRVPQALEELRSGAVKLTGLFLLSKHLTAENAELLLGQARGKSRRQLEELIAHWFPRSDVAPNISCSGAGESEGTGRLEPLSPARVRVEFTARVEVSDKIEKARQLLSHTLPNGDLGELFERALDVLIEKESRRRGGSGRQRRSAQDQQQLTKVHPSRGQTLGRQPQPDGLGGAAGDELSILHQRKPASRYIPAHIERAVWERDGAQCTFTSSDGHRCGERRFLTIEHRIPFAEGGLPTLENLCLLCSAHNLENARRLFGARQVETKIRESKALAALCQLGFRRKEARCVVAQQLAREPDLEVEQLVRKSLALLVPSAR